GEALGQVLEERFGVRPRLEFRVAGEDGVAAGAPVGATNAATSPFRPQPSRDVPEAASGVTPEPPPSYEEDAALGMEATKRPDREVSGAADKIQNQREVFAMAREWFDLDSNGD